MGKPKEVIALLQILFLGAVAVGILGLLSALVGPRGRGSPDDGMSPYVETEADYLEAGRERVAKFVADGAHPDAAQLATVVTSAQPSVVRVRVQHGSGETATTHSAGGVVLTGRRHVFTVAGALSVLDERDDCTISVAFTDGRTTTAEVVLRTPADLIDQASDWAVLRLEDLAPQGTGLRVRLMGVEELVGVLAYPDQMGERADGTIVYDSTERGLALLPLTAIGMGVMYMDVEILAGSLPRDGASGAPIIGLDGAVLGLFRELRTRRDDEGVPRFTMVPTSTEGLLDWLASDLPGAIADSR